MKTETVFETLCKDVYKTIGLEYTPASRGDEEEVEEVDCDIRKFIKKTKSYNINKDKLRTHYASKKLSKFIEESERKRRSAEEKESNLLGYYDAEQQVKKEGMIDFLNNLTTRAKVEKLHRDDEVYFNAAGSLVETLEELAHVTGVMKADRESYVEQQRRVDELQEKGAQSKAVHMMNQLGPVHNQLAEAFKQGNGESKLVLHQVRSSDTFSDHSSMSAQSAEHKSSIELNCQMKSIMAHIKYNPGENPANEIKPNDVMHGVGHIARTIKKNDKHFTDNIHKVDGTSEAKGTMQNELLYKAQKNSVQQDQAVEEKHHGHEDKMTMVLDSLVHKANGKEVEKQIAQAGKEEAIKEAMKSTLEDVKDFGKRLSVAHDAKDISYINMKHDAKAEKGHAAIVSSLGKNAKPAKKVLASESKTKASGMKQVTALRRASLKAASVDEFQVHVSVKKSKAKVAAPSKPSPAPFKAKPAPKTTRTSPAPATKSKTALATKTSPAPKTSPATKGKAPVSPATKAKAPGPPATKLSPASKTSTAVKGKAPISPAIKRK